MSILLSEDFTFIVQGITGREAANPPRGGLDYGSKGVGGLTREIPPSVAAPGLGVSTAVSIGGDAIIGSTYAELMPLYEADEQTEAIVIYTEPGGRMEAQLAEWVRENESRLPIVAFMAGGFLAEMPGVSLGPPRDDRGGKDGHPAGQNNHRPPAAVHTAAEKA